MASRGYHRLLEKGAGAPEFRLESLTGGAVGLPELLAGGPVWLAFFKVSCPICQLTFPYLERLHAAGVRIVGISQNDARDTREFNAEFGVTFPTLLDNDDNGFAASNDYGISSVPTIFLVEPGGVIGQVMEGWNKREMVGLAEANGLTLLRAGDHVPEWKAG